MEQKTRTHWVDACKGFAILAVVLGHVANGYLTAKQYKSFSGELTLLYNGIYSFHMPLFFLLSGYVYAISYPRNPKKLLVKTGDLALVYLIWSILFGGMKLVLSQFVSNKVSVSDLLWIPLRAIDHFWYLYVLIFCYLLAYWLPRSKRGLYGAVAVGGCFLFCLVPMPDYTIFRLLGYFVFFLLGSLLQQQEGYLEQLKKPYWILIHAAVGILIAVMFRKTRTMSWKDVGLLGPVMAYCLSAALIGLFAHAPRLAFLEYLGRNSLGIYILHNFCIALCRALLPKIGIHSFAVSVVLSFVIATALPLLAVWVMKKIKLYRPLFSPASFLANR